MKPFRYALDPLCILCCALYSANRWLIKPHVNSVFLHGYFNDSLLIPCALPIMLWMQRKVGLRNNDNFPDVPEIAFHLVIWSVLFEWIGPHIMNVTGDILDVAAYTGGAIVAVAWWNRRSLRVLFSSALPDRARRSFSEGGRDKTAGERRLNHSPSSPAHIP